MPRPRLDPSQRQRAAEACNLCRETKKRCSGTAPCTHCLRRGIGDTCFISNRPRRHRSSAAAAATGFGARAAPPGRAEKGSNIAPTLSSPMRSRAQRDRSSAVSDTAAVSSGHSSGGVVSVGAGFRPLSPSESRTTDADGSKTVSSQAHRGDTRADDGKVISGNSLLSTKPASRMLLNLRGERVYIGGGASLSFLQLIRSVVTAQIGPSQFSRHGRSDTMLEKESPQSQCGAHVGDPGALSTEAKLMHAESFYAVTEGIIDPFAPQELEDLLTTTNVNLPPWKRALVDAVMAVGLQCESSTDTRDRELAFFREAQSRALAGMLEDPDIDMVRVFLIMAFYLLGECRRNTAFMYLGVAARAAVALGLHSKDTYGGHICGDARQRLRLRVWMSLRVLDIIVNCLLGRPAATAGVYSDVQGLVGQAVASAAEGAEGVDGGADYGMVCLGASYDVAGLMIVTVDRLYDRKEMSIPVVEELLSELERWSRELPEFLRTPPCTTVSSSGFTGSEIGEKGAIGRVHVSVLYYFAVTLVTRPILISTLMQQQQPAGSDMVHSHMAAACLDAASFIVHTCSGARKHKLLRANMCILKAILFPAGLVLGFEIFAKDVADYTTESAFHGARDLLALLSAKSPQAALYHDILSSLSNAVAQRRGRTAAASKGRTTYVSRLFNFDRPPPAPGPLVGGDEMDAGTIVGDVGDQVVTAGEGGGVDEEQRIQIEDIFNSWSLGQNTPVNPGEVFLDWDSLDISQWDKFPYRI